MTKLILAMTRGLVRAQHTRRMTMFVTVLVALCMLFLGATFLSGFIEPRLHPVAFILYWGACAWLTLAAVLLAIVDLLALRAQARRERRLLKEEVFGSPRDHDK